MTDDTFFVECDCGCHAIKATFWPESDEPAFVCLHQWELTGAHFGWKDRLRQIWEILHYGRPCIHEVILTPKKVREFIDYLEKYAE